MYWTLIGSLLPFGVLSIVVVLGLATSTIVGKGEVFGALFILGIFFVSSLLGIGLTLILRRRYTPKVRFSLGLVTGISTPFVLSFVVWKLPTWILDGPVLKSQTTHSRVQKHASDFFSNPTGEWNYQYAPAPSAAYKSTKPTVQKQTISIGRERITWNGLTYFKVNPLDLNVLGNELNEKMEYREIDTRLSVRAVRFFKKDNLYATLEWLVESPQKELSPYQAALIGFDGTTITISDFSNRPMATLRRQ